MSDFHFVCRNTIMRINSFNNIRNKTFAQRQTWFVNVWCHETFRQAVCAIVPEAGNFGFYKKNPQNCKKSFFSFIKFVNNLHYYF